jgi:hypothetical protein
MKGNKMDKKRPIETEQDLINALEDFAYDVTEDESINGIDEELKILGYDPNLIGSKFQAMASQVLAASPLDWRNRARIEILKAREKLGLISRPDPKLLEKASLIEAIQMALKSLGYTELALIPARYRNFEEATENDLVSMLQQLNFLSSCDKNGEE